MVTLFTPTYNRADLLDRLYESVKRQTCKDFEWIIIDDGSKDNTKEKIESWKKNRDVNIVYLYQENSGKPSAYNRAVEYAKGEVLCCVDSDDYLSDNAIEVIEDNLKAIEDDDISGMFLLKQDLNGKILGDIFPDNIKYASAFELSDKYCINGEWSQIYKVSVLRKHPYPIIEGEKFITESVLFDSLSLHYKALLVNIPINFCEYQQEGLTKNIYNCLIENPTGYKIYYSQRIDLAYSWKKRLSYILRYEAFSNMSKDRKYNYSGRYSKLACLLAPFGVIGKYYYKTIRDKQKRNRV